MVTTRGQDAHVTRSMAKRRPLPATVRKNRPSTSTNRRRPLASRPTKRIKASPPPGPGPGPAAAAAAASGSGAAGALPGRVLRRSGRLQPNSTQIAKRAAVKKKRSEAPQPEPPEPPLTRRQAAKLKRLPIWYRPNAARRAVARLGRRAPPPPANKRARTGAKGKTKHCYDYQANQSIALNQMPIECISVILTHLVALPELIRVRRVCRRWNSLVMAILSWNRSLRLNLITGTTATTPKTSYRSLYYEQQTGNPVPAKQKQLILRDRHFKSTITSGLGRLLNKLQHLVIYFDLSDKRTTMTNLIALLRQLGNLTTFSFIMSTEVRNGNWLPRLAAAINTYLPRLRRLDLYMSDYNELKQYEFHPEVQLWDTLHNLRHFSLSCSPKNFYDMLVALGRADRRNAGVKRHEIESLSIQCRLYDSDIPRLFDSNNGLRAVRVLQLTCVWNREMVATFMRHFTEVRELQLCYCRTSWEIFDSEWIAGLSNLEHLTSLKLTDFGLDVAASLIKANLPFIKHLSIAAFDLIARFKADNNTRIFDGRLFCELLGTQFPFLETLEIMAYEPENAVADMERQITQHINTYFKDMKNLKLALRAPDLENAGPQAARRAAA